MSEVGHGLSQCCPQLLLVDWVDDNDDDDDDNELFFSGDEAVCLLALQFVLMKRRKSAQIDDWKRT